MYAKVWRIGLLGLLLAAGCSSGMRTVRVAVPPRVELRGYPLVGLVTFASNAKGELDRLSTQRFLRALQDAQPGTRVIELGREAEVLASVGGRAWDAPTLRAVGAAHGVDVIVLGRLDVERAAPDVRVSTTFKALSVRQDVTAALSAKLIEVPTGATVWTDAADVTANVAHARFNARGEGTFGASDPEEAYGEMIDGLVWHVTDDFRTHYVTRRVPRENLAVAGADARDAHP